MFVDILAQFAAETRNPHVTAVHDRLQAPLRVAVAGRPGVGRDTVAAALAAAGLSVGTIGAGVRVVVAAESLKPEERSALTEPGAPALVVLNKADLAGADPGGPLAVADRRAAGWAASFGVPVVPMIAHLATVELDAEDLAALRVLLASPADLTSTDAFVGSAHPLLARTRSRLLHRLDRFGLAHALMAVADGAALPDIVGRLRGLSRVHAVLDAVAAAAAPERYHRIRDAVRDLHVVAARCPDPRLPDFLVSDAVAVAVMAAAAEVVRAAGGRVETADDPDALLAAARHWQRFARGPVTGTHRRCALDIARGSLRLLNRSR
ncbi:hypothetical protein JDV09_06300 [Mycobacterium sp. Y57]|uniref:hypothetical protein n=1 Tax=Mycolicibacterium xanthum TaxID=2796469 RepID=UPI001C84D3A7|nr:hypothetical protein [Mycolicibacterium xanthum]MBX7431720.1 hypothetical protein [Mycolicibacterium xanthum]